MFALRNLDGNPFEAAEILISCIALLKKILTRQVA